MAKLQLKIDRQLERDIKKGIAWSVHAFTTFGIVAGFLALVAVLKGDAFTAFGSGAPTLRCRNSRHRDGGPRYSLAHRS